MLLQSLQQSCRSPIRNLYGKSSIDMLTDPIPPYNWETRPYKNRSFIRKVVGPIVTDNTQSVKTLLKSAPLQFSCLGFPGSRGVHISWRRARSCLDENYVQLTTSPQAGSLRPIPGFALVHHTTPSSLKLKGTLMKSLKYVSPSEKPLGLFLLLAPLFYL